MERITAYSKPHAMHRYSTTKHKAQAAAPHPNLYEQLLASGFTKQEIDNVIYKCIMYEIACKKAYQQLPFTGKIKWYLQNYSWQANRFCKQVTACITSFITQWAKKPKNPV